MNPLCGFSVALLTMGYTMATAQSHDVSNRALLEIGAAHQHACHDTSGWRDIASAPRDGTIIEIRNCYGVAPTYGLFRWGDDYHGVANGQTIDRLAPGESAAFSVSIDGDGAGSFPHAPMRLPKSHWLSIEGPTYFDEEQHLRWRPFAGDVASYVDPTAGAQNTAAYWRGAAASKDGLPLDAFEIVAERYSRRETGQLAWWERLLFWLGVWS